MIRVGPGFWSARSICCLLLASLLFIPPFSLPHGDPASARAESVWHTDTSSEFNASGSYMANCAISGADAGALLQLARVSDWIAVNGEGPDEREASAMSAIGTGILILFGGYNDAAGFLNDTWVFDITSLKWSRKSPAAPPSARCGHVMAPVFNDDKVVMFSGWDFSSSDQMNDTWTYDLSDDQWMRQSPPTSPPGRIWATAAASGNDDKAVVFGGTNYSVVFDDTWIYDVGDDRWTILPSGNPPARSFAGMATSSVDNTVVLFGGEQRGGGPLGDTWALNFTDLSWSGKDPFAPPSARPSPGMAAISNDDRVLLFGGGEMRSDTWLYDLSEDRWNRQLPDHQPSPRSSMAIATPINSNRTILFGGNNGLQLSDTWMHYMSGYAICGDYTSAPFDTGGESNYLMLNWTAAVPTGTGVRFQLRAADTAGNLSWTKFTGPSGTAGSYYTENGSVYYGHYGQRWVQYKAFLNTSDIDVTPTIDDVTIGYNRFPFAPDISSPSNGSWTNTTYPNFTWAINDTDSASQGGFEWQAGRSPNASSMNLTSGEESSGLTYYRYDDPMGEGIWYWRVRTRDAEGEWGPFSEFQQMGVDIVPPRSPIPYSIPDSNPDKWTADRVKIWFDTSDNRSGISNCTLWMDGKPWGAQDSPFWIPDNVLDGIHTVLVRAYDKAGNHAEGKVKVYMDRTPPEPFTPRTSLCWTRSEPVIEFATSDRTSGMDHFEVKLDAGQFMRQKSPLALPELSDKSLEGANDGAHDIIIRAIDKAGNIREASLTIYVDVTPPEQLQLAISPAGWTAADPVVTFSAFDDASDVDHFEARLDNGAFMDRTSPYAPANLTDGVHTLTVRAIDLAGNVAEATGHIYIDRNPPMAFSPSAEPSGWTRNDPVVTFDVTDEFSGIRACYLKVDDDQFSKTSSPSTLMQLPDGQHLVTVRAFDNAGNFIDGSVEVFIDRQPPIFVSVIINGARESTGRRLVRLAVLAQDICSGPDQMCFSPDGAVFSDWEPFAPEKNWTVPPGKGEKTVYVKVRDRAENEARAASATIIYLPLEKSSPVLLPVLVISGAGITTAVGLAIWWYLKGKPPSRAPAQVTAGRQPPLPEHPKG